MKKSKKITAILLAGSMMGGTMPTQTNCGLLSFINKNRYTLKAVAYYSLALGAIFAGHAKKRSAKNQTLPKGQGHFYANSFGGTVLGISLIPKMLTMLSIFGKNSKYKHRNFFYKLWAFSEKGITPMFKLLGAAASLFYGPELWEDDDE